MYFLTQILSFLCHLHYFFFFLSLALPPPSCADIWGSKSCWRPYFQFQGMLICFVKGIINLLFNILLIFLEAEVEDFLGCTSVSLINSPLVSLHLPIIMLYLTQRLFKHYLYQLVLCHPSLLTLLALSQVNPTARLTTHIWCQVRVQVWPSEYAAYASDSSVLLSFLYQSSKLCPLFSYWWGWENWNIYMLIYEDFLYTRGVGCIDILHFYCW